MSKLKIIGNGGGLGTFTIISPNSDTDATIELPHSGGTLITNSQDLIPTQDEVYDLGSSTKAFKDLNISSDTIFLGNIPIRSSSTGISFPEVSIGRGSNRIRLKASPLGKLKQISTDSAGVELPEVDIPQKLIDLTDVLDSGPTHGQTLIWNNTTSKFEFLTVPEVFSDFTDVDTITTPPTDTQVLTWSDANNEWGVGNNGFPLTVANTTEMIALTGMVVGQEAFVTDLNRSYTYTGSTPNDNWRHAISGWYATDDIMTNHPPAEITGVDSTYSLFSNGSSITITTAADDPDQKPISWDSNFSDTAFVTHSQTDNVFTFTQSTSSDLSVNYIPISFNVIFSAYDDSLDPVFFTTTISAFRISSGQGWPNGYLANTFGGGDMTYGRSVSISSSADTILISNSGTNVVWVRDKDHNGAYQADTTIDGNLPHFPDYADRLHPHEVGGGINGSSTYEAFTGDLRSGIYGGDGQERFSYGPRTVAISGDGLTAAVACVGETPDADRYEPTGTELLPYVEIHVRNPVSKTWTIGGKCEPTAFSSTGAPAGWTGGSGGVIVPGAGMTIALSENGTTLVVGYRLEGPHIIPHNLYADGTRTNGTNSTPDNNWYNWGSVYIYERDSNNNWSLNTKLHGNDIVGSFGASVDISGEISGGVDTRRIIVSTPNGGNGGYVTVHEKTGAGGTVWQSKAVIFPPTIDKKINNRFGFNSISISQDGTKIAVGDPGQSVTNVIESSAPYYSPDTTSVTNSGGKILSTNNFTGSQHTYPVGVVYTYEKTSNLSNGADGWEIQTNGIIENFIGVSGDGFGDSVDLSTYGDTLSIGATYEHNGFYFPGRQVGNKYINEYSAKRVFYGWYRFSHGGGNWNDRPSRPQPSQPNELDAWNYTEATEAINCTVNSSSYIGFVTPPDGKVDAFDLSVSFTSVGADDDVVSIVMAFNVDSAGREHTISLIRSGNRGYPTQYLYAIVYNFGMPDEYGIFNGNSLVSMTNYNGHGGWNNQFVRNRIVRTGDTFTVTTSQAINPSMHTGGNAQLDQNTTHTFSLGNHSFGNLFSAANGGARWGFACMSQNDSSWVNVDLADAINPEEIPDVGSVHIFERNLSAPVNDQVWEKSKRFYPAVISYGANTPQNKQDDAHFGRASLSDDGTAVVSGIKLNRDGQNHQVTPDAGLTEVFVKDLS